MGLWRGKKKSCGEGGGFIGDDGIHELQGREEVDDKELEGSTFFDNDGVGNEYQGDDEDTANQALFNDNEI